MPNHRNDKHATPESEIYEQMPEESPTQNYLVVKNLQQMPSLYSRGILYLLLLFIVAAIIYATQSKFDVVVESKAVARPVSHMMKILSDRDGYIDKIFISEGQPVQKNDPLFVLRSKETLTYQSKIDELRQAIPLSQKSYNTRISSVLDELAQLKDSHQKFISLKNLKLEQNHLTLKTIHSEEKYWQQEMALYSEELGRINNLYQKGVVSVRELNFSKVRVEKARAELDQIRTQKEITLKENAIIKEEIAKQKNEVQSRSQILEKQAQSLRLELESTLNSMRNELAMNQNKISVQNLATGTRTADSDNTVRAENSGIIAELFFRNVGDYVRQSDLLCTILPDNQPLYMDITISNRDIGFIKTGMPIKFKFDAFPYMDHGVLMGQVAALSPAAVQDARLEMVYRAQGSLDTWHFTIAGNSYPVRPGMTAIAEIITKKRSIFSILFQKAKRRTN